MKTKIFAFLLAVAGLFVFSSCEKEVHTLYNFRFDVTNVREDGAVAMVTTTYLTQDLGWGESETIDNDAMTSDKAAQQNDEEALRDFREDVSEFNEGVLHGYYRQAGLQHVEGYITYTLIRVDDDCELASEKIDVFYDAAPALGD